MAKEKLPDYIPECTCLDSAYERDCLDEGYYFPPAFEENKIYLNWIKLGKPKHLDPQPIHKQVIKDIERRATLGRAKYGKYIHPHDGDDYLQHLYEELLDAAHYIKAAIEERKSK